MKHRQETSRLPLANSYAAPNSLPRICSEGALEVKFSEVRSSKLPRSEGALAYRGGAVRALWCQLSPRWPHSWPGFVASGCDLLRQNFQKIPPRGRPNTAGMPRAMRMGF